MSSLGGYPMGAQYDSRAPYNQIDAPDEPFEVTVSITLSKTFTVEVPNPGHVEEDEDGKYWVSDREEITEDDVRLNHYLPDEILNMIAQGKNIINSPLLTKDASGWNVDELEVIEE